MIGMKHEMAELNEKNFETKKLAGELIVVSSIIVAFQIVVDGLSSDLRYLAVGAWGSR